MGRDLKVAQLRDEKKLAVSRRYRTKQVYSNPYSHLTNKNL